MWRFVIWYIKGSLATCLHFGIKEHHFLFQFSYSLLCSIKKMMKMVVMMDVYDERSKEKIIKTVATCPGLTTITMDSNDGKLTVIGEFDVRTILTKLERRWSNAKMATYGPYDPKKEAETAAAAERKRMEERERERLEAYRRNQSLYAPTHQQSCVCVHDPYHACIIS